MAGVLLAIGLVMFVEGLAWLLAPSLIERMLEVLRELSEAHRRQVGFLVVVSGLLLVWAAHQLGASL